MKPITFLLFALAALAEVAALAQLTRGYISGVAVDASGAVVPDVKITVKQRSGLTH